MQQPAEKNWFGTVNRKEPALPTLTVLHISKGDEDLEEVRVVYEQRETNVG